MIHFDCSTCGRRLRVPPDSAGRRAKCTQCGVLLTVPVPADAEPRDFPLLDTDRAPEPEDTWVVESPPPVYTPTAPSPPPPRYDDRRERRRGFECRFCGSDETPVRKSEISSAGWAVFVAMLFFCFPLFFVGLLIKEERRFCRDCGSRLG